MLDGEISNILKNVDETDIFKDLKNGKVVTDNRAHHNLDEVGGKSTLDHVI